MVFFEYFIRFVTFKKENFEDRNIIIGIILKFEIERGN